MSIASTFAFLKQRPPALNGKRVGACNFEVLTGKVERCHLFTEFKTMFWLRFGDAMPVQERNNGGRSARKLSQSFTRFFEAPQWDILSLCLQDGSSVLEKTEGLTHSLVFHTR